MGYTFRTSGPWGPGTSEDLLPDAVDQNFWQAIQDIAAKAEQGVGISNFVVSGNEMTVVLTDHTLLGPYPLPIAALSFRGEWQPSTSYLANDIITQNGSTYIVLTNHLSDPTFDPGANDGHGQDFYGLLLQNPASVIPAGGAVGQSLVKATVDDYATLWKFLSFTDLADVLQTPAPSSGDLITFDGSSFTYTSQESITANLLFVNLLDVNVNALVSGQPIIYDGSDFVNTSTVDLPFQNAGTISGTINIDRGFAEIWSVNLIGNTTLNFINWPSSGHFGRLVLRVINTGTFTLTWPVGIKWPGGSRPPLTSPGTDIYVFMTFDGGATVYGNAVGSAYF